VKCANSWQHYKAGLTCFTELPFLVILDKPKFLIGTKGDMSELKELVEVGFSVKELVEEARKDYKKGRTVPCKELFK